MCRIGCGYVVVVVVVVCGCVVFDFDFWCDWCVVVIGLLLCGYFFVYWVVGVVGWGWWWDDLGLGFVFVDLIVMLGFVWMDCVGLVCCCGGCGWCMDVFGFVVSWCWCWYLCWYLGWWWIVGVVGVCGVVYLYWFWFDLCWFVEWCWCMIL